MLKIPSAASRTWYHVVRFDKDLPVWEIFDGERLQPAQEPRPSRSLPVLVLLPDHFFFFFLPDSSRHQGGQRQKVAAAKLQMEHMFPAMPVGQDGSGVLVAGKDQYLGYYRHPKLTDFIERHRAILRRANAVTTPFFMAWNVATIAGVRDWSWVSPDKTTRVLASSHGLDYFQGNEQEWEKRLERHATVAVKHWSLTELLAAALQVDWPKLRLPMPARDGQGVDVRRLFRAGVVLMILAVLFCLGQGLRLADQKRQSVHWEQATEDLYRQLLVPPLGSDPYGRLLFRLNQLQAPVTEGMDALELLGLLSSAAPDGFQVESLSMGSNAGTVRAKLGDYEQLETLLRALEGQQRFDFSLDQATSAENEILLTLRVTY
ncbi:MAG TPA: hypothetical protein ENN39_07240 [Desulfonatronum sp.]|nr:hypothetical protein [Desulfonatronum sp.]